MGYLNIAKIAKRKALSLVLLLGMSVSLLTLVPFLPTYADTNVGVTVCGAGLTSTLTIDSPQSDSIIDTSPVKVSGTVSNATQIETYVDDQFNGIVPLSATDTTYSTNISITPGTHTIKLTAVNVCNQGNVDASVIITYQPATPPSNGGHVPTSTPGQPNGPGTGAGNIESNPRPTTTALQPQEIFQQVVLDPLENIAKDLNLIGPDIPATPSAQPAVPNMVRFALLVLGAILIFASTPLSMWLFRVAKSLHLRVLATAHAIQEERITLILAGLLSIVLMFTL